MRLRTCAALGMVILSSSVARADPQADARLAQALFDEGRALMAQKRWAEACPKLAESQRLDPGGGTLLNLALCHASEGKTATALVELQEALAAAVRDGRADREKIAQEKIAALESEVPKITVDVPPAAQVEGLEVKLDETSLSPAAWGVAAPVDPGSHVVRAIVPGRSPWTAFVSVANGERKTVTVPPLDTGPSPEIVGGLAVPEPVAGPPPPRETHANPVFWAALGLTTAAGLTGIVTGLMALDADATAEEGCLRDRNFCRTQDGRDAAEALPTLAWISTGAFVVAAIGGIALLSIPTRKEARAARPSGSFGLSPFGLRGTF